MDDLITVTLCQGCERQWREPGGVVRMIKLVSNYREERVIPAKWAWGRNHKGPLGASRDFIAASIAPGLFRCSMMSPAMITSNGPDPFICCGCSASSQMTLNPRPRIRSTTDSSRSRPSLRAQSHGFVCVTIFPASTFSQIRASGHILSREPFCPHSSA